jgi:hypothetical protein
MKGGGFVPGLINKIRKKQNWVMVGMILFISAVAYLPFIHHFGYYLDDWNLIWAGVTHGPEKLIELYSIDRPFIGYVFAGMYQLLGEGAFAWNLAAFGFRLAGAFSFWWLVRLIWRNKQHETMLMALLFAAYPGFLRQPNAIQYLMHIINFTLGVFSLAASVAALKSSQGSTKIGLILIAILTGFSSFLMMEYMIGLEGIRLAIFWLLSHRDGQQTWWKSWKPALLRYLPYAAMSILFLVWRLLIFKSIRYATDVGLLMDQYISNPFYKLLSIGANLFKDFFEVIVGGWTVVPYQLISAMRLKDFLSSLILVIFVGVGILFVFLTTRESPLEDDHKKQTWAIEAVWLGALAVLVTMLPVILSNRSVAFYNTFDRYSLPGTIGMALFLVGVLGAWGKPLLRMWLPLLMLCTAVFTHLANGYAFQSDWQAQKNLWWQTYWRIPALQDGTVLMVSMSSTGFAMEEDYEIWGPANLIYHPDEKDIMILAEVLNLNTLHAMQQGRGDERYMRTLTFDRDYERSLVLSIPSQSSCMHVLDTSISPLASTENPLASLAANYSRTELILLNPEQYGSLPVAIFGREPAHDWCYYYQKASLAEQQNDWQTILALAAEAEAANERADDYMEWLPFLHAYIFTGKYQQADGLIPILKSDLYLTSQVCFLTETALEQEIVPEKRTGYQYLLSNLCGMTAE